MAESTIDAGDGHAASPVHPVSGPAVSQRMRADARANPNSWLYLLDPHHPIEGEPPAYAYLGAYPVDANGEIIDDFRPNAEHRHYVGALDREQPRADALSTPPPSTAHVLDEPAPPVPTALAPTDHGPVRQAPAERTQRMYPLALSTEADAERTDIIILPSQLPVSADAGPFAVDEVHTDTGTSMPDPMTPPVDLERTLERIHDGELDATALVPVVLAAPLLIYGRNAQDTTVFGFRESSSNDVMVCVATSVDRVPTAWPDARVVRGRDLARHLHGHSLLINPAGPVGAIVPAATLLEAVDQ